jgi:hypothetical protein
VEVLDNGKPFVSHARVGDTFDVIGGRGGGGYGKD